MITCTRYHDFSAGHRVYGHENKCANLHGHNYRVHFTCQRLDRFGEVDSLDGIGRVIDFSVIKERLCQWLEDNWDHKFLVYEFDSLVCQMIQQTDALIPGIVYVPFNPTAENMARFLVERVGPEVLRGTGVILTQCKVQETRKCSASYALSSV